MAEKKSTGDKRPAKADAPKKVEKKPAKKKPVEKKAEAKRKPAGKKAEAKRRPAGKKAEAKRKPAEKKAEAKRRPAEKKAEAKRRPAEKKAETEEKPSKKKEGKKKKAAKKKFEGPTSDVKVNVYDINGKAKGKINLPKVFDSEVRVDLIRSAVTRARANRRQPYGPNPRGGMHHSVETWGKGRGVSRVQRIMNERRGAESPGTVGGRRAHPPRPERDWSQKMNAKERHMARMSALAATQDTALVGARGHRFDEELTLPVVVEEDFERMDEDVGEAFTKSMIEVLENLGVYEDVVRAKEGRHERAGRGKLRGRRFRTPKSLLVVVEDIETMRRFFRNMPGVEIITPEQLSTERLAPGGDPGRLTLFSVQALERIMRW